MPHDPTFAGICACCRDLGRGGRWGFSPPPISLARPRLARVRGVKGDEVLDITMVTDV